MRSTTRPKDWYCHFTTESFLQRVLWAQVIPIYQLAALPCAWTIEPKKFLPVLMGFWLFIPPGQPKRHEFERKSPLWVNKDLIQLLLGFIYYYISCPCGLLIYPTNLRTRGLSAQLNNSRKVSFRRNLDFRVCLKRSYDSAHQLVLKTNPAVS